MRPVMVADPVPMDYAIDVQIVLNAAADAALATAQVEKATQGFRGRDSRLQFRTDIVRSAAHRRSVCLWRLFRHAGRTRRRSQPRKVGVATLHQHQRDHYGGGEWLTIS